MLAALRSGDPEKIANYSDLIIPNIDNKLLALTASIKPAKAFEAEPELLINNPQAMRLRNLLISMDCEEQRIMPLVKKILEDKPHLKTSEMVAIVLGWYESSEKTQPKSKSKSISKTKWHTLDSDDLRFIYSQADPKNMHRHLKQNAMVFNLEEWLASAG